MNRAESRLLVFVVVVMIGRWWNGEDLSAPFDLAEWSCAILVAIFIAVEHIEGLIKGTKE